MKVINILFFFKQFFKCLVLLSTIFESRIHFLIKHLKVEGNQCDQDWMHKLKMGGSILLYM